MKAPNSTISPINFFSSDKDTKMDSLLKTNVLYYLLTFIFLYAFMRFSFLFN